MNDNLENVRDKIKLGDDIRIYEEQMATLDRNLATKEALLKEKQDDMVVDQDKENELTPYYLAQKEEAGKIMAEIDTLKQEITELKQKYNKEREKTPDIDEELKGLHADN